MRRLQVLRHCRMSIRKKQPVKICGFSSRKYKYCDAEHWLKIKQDLILANAIYLFQASFMNIFAPSV